MSLDFDIVLVTADEPYNGLWHTQLIYTEYLSSKAEVVFLNPPEKWKISNLLNFKSKEKRINDQLTVVLYRNVLPASVTLFSSFNEWYNQRMMKRMLKKKNVNSVLIWHFDSFRNCFDLPSFTNTFRIKRIYNVIDPFMANPKNKLLSELSDVLVITSPKNNKYYADYQHKMINIPQVINTTLSKRLVTGKIRADIDLNQEFMVLLGTISADVDLDWLIDITNEPQYRLLLIGKIAGLTAEDTRLKTLLSRSTVQYAGLMSPEEFYPVIAKAKAGLLIYNKNKRHKASSPLKVINYLVAGIPTICNLDSEIAQLNDTCIYNVANVAEFRAAVDRAFNNELPFDSSSAKAYLSSIGIEEAVNKILSRI